MAHFLARSWRHSGAVAPVLIGAVTDFAESFEEYGAAERILLLALVEVDVILVTELTRWGRSASGA
jgi:hypothetical protein